jgi:aminoglycoside phosphotransferase (APT) family kinase protein
MAFGPARDLDTTRQQLTAWLARQLGAGVAPTLSALDIPQGSGFSNETILFDATWQQHGTARSGRFVVRIKPTGRAVFPEYDLGFQVRCMRTIAAHSPIPVPTVPWLEEDAAVLGQPFFVMNRIEGQVPSDNPPYAMMGWLAEAASDDQARLFRNSIDVLAALHRLDWRAIGFQFLDRPEFGPAGMSQQLGYYRAFLPWASGGDLPAPVADAFAWLEAHQPADPSPNVLNWGDARISNMMYRDFTPVAVLDWEMATLGPGEVDLAWFLFLNDFLTEALGVPGLPGFPGPAALVTQYEALVGRAARDLHYYTIWAAFRFAAIMVSIREVMKAHGLDLGANAGLDLALVALDKVRARA